MKQRAFIFGALILLVFLLIGLNAASYVQKEEIPDTEYNPNRSTYNTGATGTRALFDLLAETKHRVTRLREPVKRLQPYDENAMSTLVIIGSTRRRIKEEEVSNLLDWVSAGGKLVVIDRNPPSDLLSTTANWSIEAEQGEDDMSTVEKDTLLGTVDPSSVQQMTSQTKAAIPTQPTVYVSEVNSVQPSKFAASVNLERYEEEAEQESDDSAETETDPHIASEPPPPSSAPPAESGSESETVDGTPSEPAEIREPEEMMSSRAPVVHLENDNRVLLVDFPFGAGEIVFLSDPYIVSNGGISLLDNSQFAINVIASRRGTIAFDEYHQGYRKNENRLLMYFDGTPLLCYCPTAICFDRADLFLSESPICPCAPGSRA